MDQGYVEAVKTDFKTAPLSAIDRALCDHAIKLTRTPWAIIQDDIDRLRSAGLTDRAVHDATQVISFFNYINRVADGLGVDWEQGMPVPGQ